MSLKIAICDDEEVSRIQEKQIIKLYLEQKEIVNEIQEYDSAEEFINSAKKVDLLFLDIKMPGMDGIQLKNHLGNQREDIKIIFVTGHEELMEDAFGRNVFGFLHKPIRLEKLERYMQRVLENMEISSKIIIRSQNKEKAILIKDILYFQANGRYSYMITQNDNIFCNHSLNELEQQLSKSFFVRCHKSYLVNLKNVEKIEEYVKLNNKERIPLSRRKRVEVKHEYSKYML